MNRKICVFCSSSDAIDNKYFKIAEVLANKIVENNDILLFGGARVGLMGTLARTVKKNNGKAIGIIPEVIKNKNLDCKILDELIITPDMHSRKAELEELADVFITLPGGFGTLEELLEVITLRQLDFHSKPIILVNTDNFFKYLIKHFETMYSENFAKSDYKKIYYITESIDNAYYYINNYQVPELESKWYRTNLNI